ncbi:MAG: hypothetical protein, partial [Olavius algarvensis Gamma 1 endosymbiont]
GPRKTRKTRKRTEFTLSCLFVSSVDKKFVCIRVHSWFLYTEGSEM